MLFARSSTTSCFITSSSSTSVSSMSTSSPSSTYILIDPSESVRPLLNTAVLEELDGVVVLAVLIVLEELAVLEELDIVVVLDLLYNPFGAGAPRAPAAMAPPEDASAAAATPAADAGPEARGLEAGGGGGGGDGGAAGTGRDAGTGGGGEPPAARRACERYREEAMESDKVKIVREGMEKLGCEFPVPEFFRCKPCGNEGIIGAFAPANGDDKAHVLLCEDNIEKFNVSSKHVERTAAHELIHAYDHCRAKLDWHNCLHLACTEIRAANLSGDCTMGAELSRGQFNIKGQGELCIRRRAELSVAGHEHCKDIAKAAVEKVFPQCIEDRAPFIGKFY